MNIEYWIQHIHKDTAAKHDFESYIQNLTSEVLKQFLTAKTIEEVCNLQGQIVALKSLTQQFNKELTKEREHATYESRFGKSSD